MTLPKMVSVIEKRTHRLILKKAIFRIILFLLFTYFFVFYYSPLLAKEQLLALKAGRVYTAAENGVIEKAILLIRNGQIIDIGPEVAIPPEAEILDFEDKFIMPGIVSPDSNLGIFRRETQPAVSFFRPSEPPGKNLAYYPVLYSIYPEHPDYQMCLKNGFTTLAISPPPEGISGLGAVISPTGASLHEILVKDRAFLKVHIFVNTPFWNMLKKSLEDAQKEIDKRKKMMEEKKKTKEKKKEKTERTVEKEEEEPTLSETTKVFMEVLEGKIPVFAECRAPDAVSQILEIASGYPQLKLVVRGGPDTYKAGHLLKEKNIPVILEPGIDSRESFYAPYPERTNYVLKCQALELKIALQAPGNIKEQVHLFHHLNNLHQLGVKKEVLLKGVTIVPAQLLGLDHLVGSLEKGKRADMIVLKHDPLDGIPVIEKVILRGKFVS